MNKVILTKAQAEALENALEFCGKRSLVIENHLTAIWSGSRKTLRDLSTETLLDALIEGYEIDPSPEEKLQIFYESLCKEKDINPYESGVKYGVVEVLNILNIPIEGVNC